METLLFNTPVLDILLLVSKTHGLKSNSLSFKKGCHIRGNGRALVCYLIYMLPLWEKTLKASLSSADQWICPGPPHYPTATLPLPLRLLFSGLSYLLIYLSLLQPTTHFLSHPLKLILIYKYLLFHTSEDVIEERMASLTVSAEKMLPLKLLREKNDKQVLFVELRS